MIRNRSIPLLCLGLLLSLAGQATSAPFATEKQISPSFRQFSVYSSRLGLDYNPVGAGIAVWNDSNPLTHVSDRIFAQRLLADGTPAGIPFVVNTGDGDVVEDASVGIDGQGNSVMVWERTLANGRSSVRARRFDAMGQPLGGEITVHSNQDSNHYDAAIAVRPDGRFVVTWSSGMLDGFGDVFMRQFSAAGLPAGPEVMINTNMAYEQVNSAITLSPDGSFAVAWEASGIRLGTDIAYRVFDPSGVPTSEEILVNSEGYFGDQRNPTIARNASGLTAIAWDCFGCDADDWGVRARFFKATGEPITAEFSVNQYITDNQTSAAVAVDADDKVLLVWASEHLSEGRTSIAGRYFGADGTPLSSEFSVGKDTASGTSSRLQVNPVARIDPNGLHRVAWADYRTQAAQTGAYVARAYAVDAGANRTISALEPIIELSGSTYAGAPISACQWSQLTGPSVALQNAGQSTANFVPPFATTTLSFQLTVQYADGTQAQDITRIDIDTDSPQVNAGMDQAINEGELMVLNGAANANNGGSIVAYKWQQTFGPAVALSDSSVVNPSFTAPSVTADSMVTLRLTVTDNDGQTGTDTVNLLVRNINQAPIASFTVGTSDLTANFLDASSDSDGSITSRSWDFGDGSGSSAKNPTHTYAAAGTYTVNLAVTDDLGASRQVSQSVSVTAPPANAAPVANFNFSVNNATVSFVDASSDPDGSIASRQWSFGDGSTSTATNPARTYATIGTYAVTLTVTDNRGASAQVVKNVTINSIPIPENQLQNGVPKTSLSGAKGSERYFTFVVPAAGRTVSVQISGGTGDADLYVRFGAPPNTSGYDCRPYLGGNSETCNISNARAGTYHVMLRGYSGYSGLQLVGRY